MRALACVLIRLYQSVFSPLLHAIGGPSCGCRFTPTCSEYCLQAINSHGVLKGGGLGALRILRCNPWGPTGIDPVPPANR